MSRSAELEVGMCQRIVIVGPKRLVWLVLLGVGLACAPAPAPLDAAAAAEWRKRGAAAVAPFKQRLLGELTAALERGPEHALEVCRLRAPVIAAESSSKGVRVGRTSHALRNPQNVPPAWAAPLLAEYLAAEGAREARVVRLANGGVGYVEPIFVAPMCLICHGDAIGPALRARLAQLYPEDRAVGFRGGDFRGLFWAELEDGEGQEPDPSR